MNGCTDAQAWTAVKGATSASYSSTRNALSIAETNLNNSYSTNTGASRPTLSHVSAPFSLEHSSAEVFSSGSTPMLYSMMDQRTRDAVNATSSATPLLDESLTAAITFTPRHDAVPHIRAPSEPHHTQQLGKSAAPCRLQAPQWISAVTAVQQSSIAAESLLSPNLIGNSNGAAAPAWHGLSLHASLHHGLTSPVAPPTPTLPQPLSLAAVHHHPQSSQGRSDTSTPACEHTATTTSFSSVVGVNSASSRTSHGNTEVVITGAVAAGAQPSSNAATHYKTKRCRHFDQSGWCPYQHRCVFAHGDREFALYTARKNEVTSGAHPKTSQQVKDHIARNVNQLVEEYEQAVAEAASSAKAKSSVMSATHAHAAAVNAVPANVPPSALTMVTDISSGQTASQLSSAASQHSGLHLVAASPLATGAVMAQAATATNSSIPLFHYQPQPQPQQVQVQVQQQHLQQQQQQITMLSQHPIYVAAANSAGVPTTFSNNCAPAGTTFTVLPANTAVQTAPQSLYLAHPQQHNQQQQQQQPQFLFAVSSNSQNVYQLHSQQQPQQFLQQQQQQQQQPIYVVEAPFLRTVQMNGSGASHPATMQHLQSNSAIHAYPAGSYVSANGAAFSVPGMLHHST